MTIQIKFFHLLIISVTGIGPGQDLPRSWYRACVRPTKKEVKSLRFSNQPQHLLVENYVTHCNFCAKPDKAYLSQPSSLVCPRMTLVCLNQDLTHITIGHISGSVQISAQ